MTTTSESTKANKQLKKSQEILLTLKFGKTILDAALGVMRKNKIQIKLNYFNGLHKGILK